jgi:hypothetical protein
MPRPKNPNQDVADMAEAILRVAEAGEALLNSGVTQNALVILLQDEIGVKHITRDQVRYVLVAIPRLKTYLQ